MITNRFDGQRPGDVFGALLDEGAVLSGGAFDCLSAAVLERAGFPTVFLSGAGVAASTTGLPDLGLTTASEVIGAASHVIMQASVPVIVDIDTGFGNEVSTARTVQELGRLGAAGVMLEDQVAPKRCGHLAGKEVTDLATYLRKVRAAVDAAAPYGLRIIARTDALGVNGVDDAIERAIAAIDAGAHLTLVEAPRSVEQIERIGREVPGHKMYGVVTGGVSPDLSIDELHAHGYNYLNVPGVAMIPAIEAMDRMARAVLAQRSDEPLRAYNMGPRDIFETVGLNRWNALADRYTEAGA